MIRRFRERAARSKRLSVEILDDEDAQLIEKLHLTDGSYLKRAAVMLFYSNPECFVTGAFVKIGFFMTDSDLLYHDEIHGDLFTQVDKTMDLEPCQLICDSFGENSCKKRTGDFHPKTPKGNLLS